MAISRGGSSRMGLGELERLNKERHLSLDKAELEAVDRFFKDARRAPNLAELEMIAQAWSEHTRHKTLRGTFETGRKRYGNLLKETVFEATRLLKRPWVLSAFKDNAGIVALDKKWAVAIKVETHNHPSALHPYGGASTGLGGVIRDILGSGRGAVPIASLDVFCVSPKEPQTLSGLVAGVRDYGNRMGIPTVCGLVDFHEDFSGLPLVFCGAVGLLPKNAVVKPRPRPGDLIYVTGSKTGRDGIHGATFSSKALEKDLPSSVVQIGNPILEKKLLDFLIEARRRRLYSCLTDLGAGGIACGLWELADWEDGGLGVSAELDVVPLKEPDMHGWEILVSESQERMMLVVAPSRQKALEQLLADFELDFSSLGRFVRGGQIEIRFGQEALVNLPLSLLKNVPGKTFSIPSLERDGAAPRKSEIFKPALLKNRRWANKKGLYDLGLALMAAPNIACKEPIIRRYDHEVGGRSVIKPLGGAKGLTPNDAAVIRPLYDSFKGIALGLGFKRGLARLNPRLMAHAAVEEALRNVIAVGGHPESLSLLDNYCAGLTAHEQVLSEIVSVSEGLREAALCFGAPFVSGKDSLNNTAADGVDIPTVILVTALGVLKDIRRCVSAGVKVGGHDLYIVGLTELAFAGSEAGALLDWQKGLPWIDFNLAPKILRATARLLSKGLVRSCHDLSDGGLFVALAEMLVGSSLGFELDLAKIPASAKEPLALLFAESNSRFLLEAHPGQQAAIAKILQGLPHALIGRVITEPRLQINNGFKNLVYWKNQDIENAYVSFKGLGS